MKSVSDTRQQRLDFYHTYRSVSRPANPSWNYAWVVLELKRRRRIRVLKRLSINRILKEALGGESGEQAYARGKVAIKSSAILYTFEGRKKLFNTLKKKYGSLRWSGLKGQLATMSKSDLKRLGFKKAPKSMRDWLHTRQGNI